MWKDKQKQRFQRLRTYEQRQELTDVERVELSRMVHDIEEEEASYLQPATRQLEKRNLLIAGQNTALKTLFEREEQLNRYLLRALKKLPTSLEPSHKILRQSESGEFRAD